MKRFLIRIAIFLGTSAIALLACALVLHDFHLRFFGFLTSVIVFTIAQSVLAPLVLKITREHAPALLGGVGLGSSFLALVVAVLLPGGIGISSLLAWVVATLIVWVITALGTWLLPRWLLPAKTADAAAGSRP